MDIKKLKTKRFSLYFILTGILATIWFLVRVIPKPSRAGYPCVKAAAPIMSGFVMYILSIAGTAAIFKIFKTKLEKARFIPATLALFAAFGMLIISDAAIQRQVTAFNKVSATSFSANSPIGKAQGLFPGRVVWVWNKEATPHDFEPANNSNGWWANHTNPQVVEEMLNDAILSYSEKNSIAEGWDALFKHFNNTKGKGENGYTQGEKIYIKINTTNSCCSLSGTRKTSDFDRMDSTPELMLALLKHLIEGVGVNQENIFMGDPFRTFHDLYWDKCQGVYPNVNYCDGEGASERHQTIPTEHHVFFLSDGQHAFRLPQEYYEADYFINLPCLKTHDTAGITLGAKNHMGSVLQDGGNSTNQSAYSLHYTYPQHDNEEGGSHRYRVLVDFMGHEKLGGNTLLTIVDGIWAGRSWQGYVEKWQMAPFNGDYPNSLLISQDLVAIESVCYDFLLEEYSNRPESQQHPYMSGTNDYLFQAADPSYWPDGVSYDPENDGTLIASLGVYEHWNNADEKKYSRNLGTGQGIELIEVFNNDFPKIITTENSELPSNMVNSIFIEPEDVAWFGTNQGLVRFNGTDWDIYDTNNHLQSNVVNNIAHIESGTKNELWISTNGGVTVATISSEGITDAFTYTPENSDLVGMSVIKTMVDMQNIIWVGTNEAINIFDGTTWINRTSAADGEGYNFNFSDYSISDVVEYEIEETTLISTKGKGIIRSKYNNVDGFTGASTYGQPWASMSTDTITSIAVIGEAQWYGSVQGAMYHPESETKSQWDNYTVENSNLLSNHITAIHADKDENIWMGTNNGLNIFTAGEKVFEYTESDGLVSNTINVIVSDTKGNIWVGTSGGIQWFENVPGNEVNGSSLDARSINEIEIYPNPASNYFRVNLSKLNTISAEITIYNTNGQVLHSTTVNTRHEKLIEIDISDKTKFAKGTYIVTVDTEKFLKADKIVIR